MIVINASLKSDALVAALRDISSVTRTDLRVIDAVGKTEALRNLAVDDDARWLRDFQWIIGTDAIAQIADRNHMAPQSGKGSVGEFYRKELWKDFRNDMLLFPSEIWSILRSFTVLIPEACEDIAERVIAEYGLDRDVISKMKVADKDDMVDKCSIIVFEEASNGSAVLDEVFSTPYVWVLGREANILALAEDGDIETLHIDAIDYYSSAIDSSHGDRVGLYKFRDRGAMERLCEYTTWSNPQPVFIFYVDAIDLDDVCKEYVKVYGMPYEKILPHCARCGRGVMWSYILSIGWGERYCSVFQSNLRSPYRNIYEAVRRREHPQQRDGSQYSDDPHRIAGLNAYCRPIAYY